MKQKQAKTRNGVILKTIPNWVAGKQGEKAQHIPLDHECHHEAIASNQKIKKKDSKDFWRDLRKGGSWCVHEG